MNKQNAVYIYNGLLFSLRFSWIIVSFGGTWKIQQTNEYNKKEVDSQTPPLGRGKGEGVIYEKQL